MGRGRRRAGIPLDPTLSNAVGPVRPDMLGYVTTYAQVAGKPTLHAARTGAKRTLVVLDEVHHAGDGLSWGDAVGEAFADAARRLCLTGTPFRTRPDERIPFVRYDAGADGGWRATPTSATATATRCAIGWSGRSSSPRTPARRAGATARAR